MTAIADSSPLIAVRPDNRKGWGKELGEGAINL